jgi:hypothetical protein
MQLSQHSLVHASIPVTDYGTMTARLEWNKPFEAEDEERESEKIV